MVKKRKGRSVRRNQQVQSEPEDVIQAPHSFIIHRGLPGGHIVEVTKDFRKVMEPFTASTLKERKKNTIKDFVQIASVLHVSHMCIFTRTDLGMYLKIAKLPRGPTLTFKMHSFTLAKDVVSSLKKQFVFDEAFKHSPLIVLNSFSGEGMHMKLMATTFQNMFPTINLTNINLNTIRRVVLLNYNPATKLIEFRHYAIKVIPVGVSKGVKKVVQGKVPNLARCDDIADFLTKTAMLSESEFEDDANNEVTLPQKLSSRGNMENKQSAIRLSELGPRLTMQLMKVEDGLLDGEVLFHELVHKTEEEVALINKKREQKKKLKEYRKKEQDLNTQKKEEQKEVHKQRSLEGMQKKGKTESDRLMKQAAAESNRETQVEDDDDVEYYRQEVGEEPEKDLFSANANRKRPMPSQDFQSKKPRFDNESGNKPHGNKFDKPQGNKFDKPQGNKFDKPRGNKFDKPNGNKFDKPRGNKFDKPNGNKFDKPRGNKFDKPRGNKFDKPRGNKFDKPRDNKFDKKKGFKPNRRSDGSPDKKWPGGRGGNPKYGLKARNGEDDDQPSFAGKKGKGKPHGGKVHGSKVNKMKNKRR